MVVSSTQWVELRDDALELYEEISDSERIVLHWGMTSAVYPFVLVAETVGRLLRFQETFTVSQVRERVEGILEIDPQFITLYLGPMLFLSIGCSQKDSK